VDELRVVPRPAAFCKSSRVKGWMFSASNSVSRIRNQQVKLL